MSKEQRHSEGCCIDVNVIGECRHESFSFIVLITVSNTNTTLAARLTAGSPERRATFENYNRDLLFQAYVATRACTQSVVLVVADKTTRTASAVG